MTIWLPVMFGGELDMLDMRLAETALHPARHVLAEAPVTHRGLPKPLYYAENAERFAAYADRIDHVVVSLDGIEKPWDREHAQRDAAWAVIDAQAADDDLVIITDLDEFPSPSVMAWQGHGAVSLHMKTTLFAVDWLVPPSHPLPPTAVMANAGYLRKMRRLGLRLGDVRDRRGTYRVITDGGWHFSWTGGPEAQRAKLERTTCHTELLGTTEGELIRSGERYMAGKHGDGHIPVVAVDVDQSWPAWIRERRCPPLWFRPRDEPAVLTPPGTAGMTVMLTCWRRPHYFEQTLRSWARAAAVYAPDRIVVALGHTDKAAENQRIIADAKSWCPVPVEIAWQSPQAEASAGVHRAIGEAARAIFTGTPGTFLVFGEEDIAVSDDVLAYMDWARWELRADKRVLTAVAHSRHGQGWDQPGSGLDPDADQSAVRLLPYFNGWVWGTWADRWEQVLEPNWDWECNSGGVMDSGYDWNIFARILPRYKMVSAVPAASRSQNIGQHDGWSGSADAQWFAGTQAASFRQHRDPVKYRLT